MALRRGFKTEAKQIAAEIRSELGLSDLAPLDPVALAGHLAIDVIPLSELSQEAPNSMYFLGEGCDEFSAITIFVGSARIIIHNDSHSEGRQRSNLAHELSHALLQPPPMPALTELGVRNFNADMEDEATWLAGVLLIPERLALHIARNKFDLASAATRYGVSPQMIRYRLNVTGAYRRVASFQW